MKKIEDWIVPDSRRHVISELRRLNDNFERYLDHLKVPARVSKQEIDQSPSRTLYIGEPMSELEMALKEHAIATGQEWPQKDDK